MFGGNGFRGFAKRYNTEPNTIIIGRYGALCGNVRITEERVWCTEHAFRVAPYAPFHTGFMRWLLEHLDLNKLSARTAQPGLNSRLVRDHSVSIPPLPEQRAIATFLDEQTARIDELIARKRRLLDLLAEKRRAIITRAVTRGLDPTLPLKDTGTPWLGSIPAHWQVKRLRFLLRRIEQGWSPPCEDRQASEGEWGVLKVGCVNHGSFRIEEHKALSVDQQPVPELRVRAGDLLLSRGNTRDLVGSAAIVPQHTQQLMLCDLLYRLVTNSAAIDAKFLCAFLNARPGRHQIEVAADGSSGTMPKISSTKLADLVICVPPLKEQEQIQAVLALAEDSFSATASRVRAAIHHLAEYRSALITAAVTGRIDVTTARQETPVDEAA